MYIRFVIYLILDLLANLTGYMINIFLPSFANSNGNLPKCLSWFQTYDSTLDGTEIRFISATSWLRDSLGEPTSVLNRYVLRVLWLYRNNAYGFAYSVLGAKGPFTVLSASGIEPSDRNPAVGGSRYTVFSSTTGKKYFQYKSVKDRGNGKCFETSIGWKPTGQFVFRWTPFRKFNG